MLAGFGRILIVLLCTATFLTAGAADARLSLAAMNGDMAGVQSLLKQKADINAAQGDGTTALHWAAFREDIAMARVLLKAGANVKATTRLGEMTPLFMAAKNGNAAMIDLLLKAGADAKSTTTTGTTALMMAAASGHPEAVRVLLDNGAEINAKDVHQGQTALMFAAALGRSEVLKLLAERGADLNATSLVPTRFQRQPRGEAQQQPQTNRQNQQNSEAAPRRRNNSVLALGGMTALQFAARDGHKAAVETLVAAGADVNILTASDQMSALTIAIMNGQFDIAKFLLDKGADPKPASAAGVTALFMLVDAQWAHNVWYPPPSVDQEKTSYLDLLKDILAKGADPNAKMGPRLWLRSFHNDWVDPAGATAFWRAAQANDVAAMRILMEAGADPNIRATGGVTPLQVAAGYGMEPQVSTFVPGQRRAAIRFLIEEAGADVNAKDDKGYTPLHGAALTGDNELILYMIAKGADVKARATQTFSRGDGPSEAAAEGKGDTVADMANGPRERNLVYPETIALLEKLGAENSDNCRASICIIKPRADTPKR